MSTEAKKAPATEKGSAAEKRKEKGAPGNNGDSAPAKDLAATTPEIRRELLHSMMLQRRFEERCAEAYALGKIGGFCHLYIGQEAISTGVMSMIRPDDYVITAYRDHGQALARGVSPRSVMAELFGRATGCSGGKGGSMHIFDAKTNFLGGHGIVGGHVPIAAGVGFAIKYRRGNQVCVCFFGEAAVNIGAFHEALNLLRYGICPSSSSSRTIATAWARRSRARPRTKTYSFARKAIGWKESQSMARMCSRCASVWHVRRSGHERRSARR